MTYNDLTHNLITVGNLASISLFTNKLFKYSLLATNILSKLPVSELVTFNEPSLFKLMWPPNTLLGINLNNILMNIGLGIMKPFFF